MKALTLMIVMTLSTNLIANERDIIINEVIQSPQIMHKASDLLYLVDDNLEPINIVLNSPGGSVFAGLQFINAMEIAKARGVILRCHVVGMAASMAFQILAHCDERYALRYSLLLWHPVRIGFLGTITPALAEQMKESMNLIEEDMNPTLLETLGIEEALYYKHYHWETLHTAVGIDRVAPSFLQVVDDTKYTSLLKVKRAKKRKNKRANKPNKMPTNELLYIHPKALELWNSQ